MKASFFSWERWLCEKISWEEAFSLSLSPSFILVGQFKPSLSLGPDFDGLGSLSFSQAVPRRRCAVSALKYFHKRLLIKKSKCDASLLFTQMLLGLPETPPALLKQKHLEGVQARSSLEHQ